MRASFQRKEKYPCLETKARPQEDRKKKKAKTNKQKVKGLVGKKKTNTKPKTSEGIGHCLLKDLLGFSGCFVCLLLCLLFWGHMGLFWLGFCLFCGWWGFFGWLVFFCLDLNTELQATVDYNKMLL